MIKKAYFYSNNWGKDSIFYKNVIKYKSNFSNGDNMIRFRNPGTEYSTQIQVIKELYKELWKKSFFSLDDMAIVIAKSKLMTAYGYAGDQAIELSNTEQESLNSAKMNAKMYAEVFRMLGWVTPYSKSASYPLSFTYIGIHIANSKGDCAELYEQCVLGINNPTQLTNNMSYCEKVRFFKCALRTLIDLNGIMYKHELCLGPMSIDDQDEKQYKQMINYLKGLRGNYNNLKTEFKKLANKLGMKETPVDNCTRLPIALMKSCGWIITVTDKELYKKSMTCIKITDHGRKVYDSIKRMKDVRLEEFENYSFAIQNSLIRLGVYQMLERSGYDISKVNTIIHSDEQKCSEILKGEKLLFSPCQTIRREQVENALGIKIGGEDSKNYSVKSFESTAKERMETYNISTIDLNVQNFVNKNLLTEKEDINFLLKVEKLKKENLSTSKIVDTLFEYYRSATQTVFYPLISTLFKIMGLRCSYSRTGDNGSRWDAIIEDEKRSIPIEIKSPTEEEHLSIKAIRQALENKIILLSRKTFKTDKETSSLAVGYYLPNERAEVNTLIQDIKETYCYKIGVIDFKSLLSISVSILIENKGFDLEKLYNMEGLSNANI